VSKSPLGHQLMHTQFSGVQLRAQSDQAQLRCRTDELVIEGRNSRARILGCQKDAAIRHPHTRICA